VNSYKNVEECLKKFIYVGEEDQKKLLTNSPKTKLLYYEVFKKTI